MSTLLITLPPAAAPGATAAGPALAFSYVLSPDGQSIGQQGNTTAGLLVDAVSDILTVPQEEMQPPPEVGADPSARCIDALLLVDGKLIRVLDLKVLPPNEARDAA